MESGLVLHTLADGAFAIAIGGKYLDEVQIAQRKNAYVSFPVERHRGVIGDDGAVTVHAMMPSALQLFAEGRLPRVGGAPVEWS